MNNQPLRWGIVGLGNIANHFATDLLLVENAKLQAVASRSISKAADFAKKYDAEKSYASYDELFQDDQVDIIYIATPHDSHAELSIAAMNAGKHVLCEKPLAVNQSQVQSMIEVSRKNNVFLMEAFWSRFNPTIRKCLELVKNKTIGEVNYVKSDFTFYRAVADDSRMFNMNLAGGSLLDIGVYPIFLAYLFLGKPEQILATGHAHATGADIQTAAIFKYKNGMATMMSGFASNSDMVANICGTGGSIFIHPIWHQTHGYTLLQNGASQKFSMPTKGRGFTYEIEECIKCIAESKTESDNWSHQNSLDLIEIADEIRKQIGLKYPFE